MRVDVDEAGRQRQVARLDDPRASACLGGLNDESIAYRYITRHARRARAVVHRRAAKHQVHGHRWPMLNGNQVALRALGAKVAHTDISSMPKPSTSSSGLTPTTSDSPPATALEIENAPYV